MPPSRIPKRPIVTGSGHGSRTITLADGMDAISDLGLATAFGASATSHVGFGVAMAHGLRGLARSGFLAVASGSGGTAIGSQLAVALGAYAIADRGAGDDPSSPHRQSVAASGDVAFAWNIFTEARAARIAVAAGKYGLADAPLAIALGENGLAVARAGGTIAIAFYDRHPGRWEFPHGCDQTGVEGETFLAGLKVARVGENHIRPDVVYKLDGHGEFVEVRAANPPDLQVISRSTQ